MQCLDFFPGVILTVNLYVGYHDELLSCAKKWRKSVPKEKKYGRVQDLLPYMLSVLNKLFFGFLLGRTYHHVTPPSCAISNAS